jgi:hypothetical protein
MDEFLERIKANRKRREDRRKFWKSLGIKIHSETENKKEIKKIEIPTGSKSKK